MWNKDTARRSSMTLPRNLSPVNTFPSSPRQFAPPPVSGSAYAPQHHPFFRNTFSPVRCVPQIRDNSPSRVPQSSDTGHQGSFSFAKHALHRTGGVSPLSPSEILRAPYSPSHYSAHQQNKPSVSSLEQFPNNTFVKTEVNLDKPFGFQNSPPPQIPFLSERKSFGGIPFISDATADSSSPYSNYGMPASSAVKQEDDSLDCYYNRHTPSDENHESTPSRSFERGNSSLDHSVFSQKSDDSYLSEGNHCEPNINEDSQSRSSFPVIDSSADTSTRKPSTRPFSEDTHHGPGDSDESACKRQKLSHDLDGDPADLQRSAVEEHKTEDGAVAGDSVENSSKCQKPDDDKASDPNYSETSELEKHITEVSEPVVGLDYLQEYKKENAPPSVYTYKCSLCKCSILAKHVLMHILSTKHRLRYLKAIDESEHQRIMKFRASQDELASIVIRAVADLEVKHGRGSVKIVFVPSSETKNSEENIEDSYNISPTVSTPDIVPPTDGLLLDKIPEPPDLKLLNDILSTAHTLQHGVSKEFTHCADTGKNEELQEEDSPKCKAGTTGPKWQLDCEIPPPPPLPFAERGSSSWNRDTSHVETSPSHAGRSPSGANAVTNHSPCSSKTDTPKEYASSECGLSISTMGLSKTPVKNDNSEVKDTSSIECSDHGNAVSEATVPGSDDLKLKNDQDIKCEPEVLPRIPLINDTAYDDVQRNRTSESISIPAPFNDIPAEGAVFTEEEEELGKAAIFEHLSLCTITNEAEASLVEKIIITLSEMYFSYKLRDLTKSESESLLQALHLGEKEGVEKLTSILYRHSATDDSFSENDGNLNSGEEHNTRRKNDGVSSPLQSVKAEESETDKTFKSNLGSVPPSTQEGGGSKLGLNLASHNGHQVNNADTSSPSSLAEAKSNNDTKDAADANPVKEAMSEKCSEGNIAPKDGENSQKLAELTFVPPLPPPPPPPAESASQIVVSEQASYSQASASYGSWPMAYYAGATQAGSYMYWPSQNMGGMDPSLMSTQYIMQSQNSDTNLYTWCQQAPPPLPPPPPPPPPPPTSTAP